MKGHGFALLQRALLHAANLGYRTLFMHCLAENGIMLHLPPRPASPSSSKPAKPTARLKLDRVRHGGAFMEAIADQMALVDIMFKQGRAAAKLATTPA